MSEVSGSDASAGEGNEPADHQHEVGNDHAGRESHDALPDDQERNTTDRPTAGQAASSSEVGKANEAADPDAEDDPEGPRDTGRAESKRSDEEPGDKDKDSGAAEKRVKADPGSDRDTAARHAGEAAVGHATEDSDAPGESADPEPRHAASPGSEAAPGQDRLDEPGDDRAPDPAHNEEPTAGDNSDVDETAGDLGHEEAGAGRREPTGDHVGPEIPDAGAGGEVDAAEPEHETRRHDDRADTEVGEDGVAEEAGRDDPDSETDEAAAGNPDSETADQDAASDDSPMGLTEAKELVASSSREVRDVARWVAANGAALTSAADKVLQDAGANPGTKDEGVRGAIAAAQQVLGYSRITPIDVMAHVPTLRAALDAAHNVPARTGEARPTLSPRLNKAVDVCSDKSRKVGYFPGAAAYTDSEADEMSGRTSETKIRQRLAGTDYDLQPPEKPPRQKPSSGQSPRSRGRPKKEE